jgi:hypothetical protein
MTSRTWHHVWPRHSIHESVLERSVGQGLEDEWGAQWYGDLRNIQSLKHSLTLSGPDWKNVTAVPFNIYVYSPRSILMNFDPWITVHKFFDKLSRSRRSTSPYSSSIKLWCGAYHAGRPKRYIVSNKRLTSHLSRGSLLKLTCSTMRSSWLTSVYAGATYLRPNYLPNSTVCLGNQLLLWQI